MSNPVEFGPARPISGGGMVSEGAKSPDGRGFVAIVTMNNGTYPNKEEASYAVNVNQAEFIVVLEGNFVVTLDGESYPLEAGGVAYLAEGVKYTISGSGKVAVTITPAQGGKTDLIK